MKKILAYDDNGIEMFGGKENIKVTIEAINNN